MTPTMANKWFETVAVAQRRAKRRLPKSVYGALIAGAEAGVTVRDNVAAFAELGFAPHVAGLPATREMATTVMGQQIPAPAGGHQLIGLQSPPPVPPPTTKGLNASGVPDWSPLW